MGLLFISLVLLPTENWQLLNRLADWFLPDHLFCLGQIRETAAQPILATMVCGAPLQTEIWRDWLARSGLFHVVIVAQAHWLALAWVLEWMADRTACDRKSTAFFCSFGFLLTALTCMSGFPAPLTRSLCHAGLNQASRIWRWNWTPEWILLASLLVCWLLQPRWLESLSLLHSVGCAVTFRLAKRCQAKRGAILILAFVLSAPFLWGWGQLHPLSLVIGTLLSPLLLLVWWSGSVFSWLIPPTQIFWGQCLEWQRQALIPFLDPLAATGGSMTPLPNLALWFWVLFLWLGAWLHARCSPAR